MSQLRHRDYKALHMKKMSNDRIIPYWLRASIADDLAYMDIRLEDEADDRSQFITNLKQRLNPSL